MPKRIVTSPPRLVGKPLDGDLGTSKGERAEAAKNELQTYLRQLEEALNQLQEDFWATQSGDSSEPADGGASISSFFLMGA